MENIVNPREALLSFCAWLLCNDEAITMLSKDDCVSINDLIEKFCDANNLPDVSKDYPYNIKYPSVTGV